MALETTPAEYVRMLRERLGLSLPAFGKQLGVSGTTVFRWESGRSIPRKKKMQALLNLAVLNELAEGSNNAVRS